MGLAKNRKAKGDCGGGASQGNGGFSLLEIVVALAIVSISMVALLTLCNRSIAVHERLRKMTQATLLAQHKMAEAEAFSQGKLQAGGEREGYFAEPFTDFGWRLEYSDTAFSPVRMVTVTVYWGDEKENESVAINSFVF